MHSGYVGLKHGQSAGADKELFLSLWSSKKKEKSQGTLLGRFESPSRVCPWARSPLAGAQYLLSVRALCNPSAART